VVPCQYFSSTKERYKARIAASGFSMKPGDDYFDTHASVVRSTTTRILLSLAAALGMIVELADVETTYLNAALCEFVHAEQPLYFEPKDHAKYVLLLNQALYGLPQSGFELAATPLLKPLGSTALLTTTTSIPTIPTIPTIANAQQQF
jgi:Reverse transcriptase (RNA-dependent DNA polymerase)